MASRKPSSASASASAPAPAPAPAADTADPLEDSGPFAYEAFLPVLFGAAVKIALRLCRGDGLAAVAFPDLTFALLVLSGIWFQLSPPGYEARRWARFALWVFSSSITVGVAWGLVGPPPFEAVARASAAGSTCSCVTS